MTHTAPVSGTRRGDTRRLLLPALLLLLGSPVLAQGGGTGQVSSPLVLIVVFGAISLAPFVLILITAFTKIVVVLGLLKNALGTQQVPPTQVITGLAFLLTIIVMAPVGQAVYSKISDLPGGRDMFSQATVRYIFQAADQGKEPVREFLLKHSHEKDRALFVELNRRMAASPRDVQTITPRDFRVVVPAFVISELKEAFLIGFLLYIPFIVIDMIVSNILLSMGMFMLSPVTISLPFKLLLFVLVDGWYLIVRGLVLSYV